MKVYALMETFYEEYTDILCIVDEAHIEAKKKLYLEDAKAYIKDAISDQKYRIKNDKDAQRDNSKPIRKQLKETEAEIEELNRLVAALTPEDKRYKNLKKELHQANKTKDRLYTKLKYFQSIIDNDTIELERLQALKGNALIEEYMTVHHIFFKEFELNA